MSVLLSRSQRSTIYREKNTDNKDVIWKVCGDSKNSIAELANEFRLLTKLNQKGLRKPVEKGFYENKEAFCYEFAKGQTLKEYIENTVVDGADFLKISTKICEVLKVLHQEDVVHLRLNSSNIILDPKTFDITIIDLSLGKDSSAEVPINLLEWGKEIEYAAPEQVQHKGKMFDERTDLYSLGIIFYELLTKRTPFVDSTDSIIAHSHLVKMPTPPVEIDGKINPNISELILKLLAKDPGDRYQSVFGLEYDLLAITDRFILGTVDDEFKLGKRDQSDKLFLSTRLYGRGNQISQLKESFDSLSDGQNSIFFLSGKTGSGKTALAEDFERYVQDKEAILITGRINSSEQNLPHRGLISTLKDLANYIMSQPSERHLELVSILQNAVGDIGEVLIEIIPEFQWIFDRKNQIDDLPGNQSQNRINFLFQRIIQEIAKYKGPVVLFIDDLQWTDQASWNSILNIVRDKSVTNFMFIGTYVVENQNQILSKGIEELRKTCPNLEEIVLEDLNSESIERFINDSFKTTNIADLVSIILSKTHGNPYHIRQFINTIKKDGTLQYSQVLSQWVWNKKSALLVEESDNVVQIYSEKVNQVSERKLNVLVHAACIGKRFKINLLNEIIKGSEKELGIQLIELTELNLLEQLSIDEYQFLHEQIREVAYSAGSSTQITSIHYKIAEILEGSLSGESPEQLFELVRQFNLGLELLPGNRRFQIVELNMKAGVIASKMADFGLAVSYFRNSIELVQPEDWTNHYSTVLELYNNAAEAGMISGDTEDAEIWLQISLTQANSITDRIKAHEIKLNHFAETHQFAETVAHLLTVLEEIGYSIKRNPSKLSILKEFLGVKWQMRNKKITDIPDLPAMKDENALAFMRLTVSATVPIFGHAPDILPIVFFRLVRLSLKYGNSVYAPFGYISYGFAISVFMGKINEGYEFGKMALELIDRLNAQIVKTKVMVVFYGFLSYWKDTLRIGVEPLRQAYFIGRQTGDILYASFASSFHGGIRLYSGDNLAVLLETLTEDCQIVKQLHQELVYEISSVQRQYVVNLIRPLENQLLFNSDGFDEQAFFDKLVEIDDQATAFRIYNYKLGLGFIFNRYEEAFEFSLKAGEYEDETTSRQIGYPSFLWFKGMAGIKISGISSKHDKSQINKNVRKKIKLLEEYASLAPQNYANKVSLLKALLHQSKNEVEQANKFFYLSISEAQQAGFIHEEAIAREHYAYFYIEQGMEEYFEMMLQKAYACYQSWGALAKCEQLKRKFPEVITSLSIQESGVSGFQDVFDINTIISANQALSSENNLEGLLNRTLDIFVNNVTSSKIIIILVDKKNTLRVRGVVENNTAKIILKDESGTAFPESIVNFVFRSKSTMVSKNLSEDIQFRHDRYVKTYQPKSVCCLPISSKGNLLGIIYLENNITEDAFDAKRVEFYKTICSQLAISLENVTIYSELEEKVKERTIEIEEKNVELTYEKKRSDDLLLNILPEDTAEELKNHGKTTAQLFSDVTVLFCDIKDFTNFAEKLPPQDLIHQLDICFVQFDEICKRFGLEKIKTIGDAYIAAAGVPKNNSAAPSDAVQTAVEMQKFVKETREVYAKEGKKFFEIRIGIHTGPVVAGVVGSKKFQFDIWGDTVNLAARMEQSCEVGKINISEATFHRIQSIYDCQSRGKIQSKNKGNISMYYVLRRKKEIK